MQNELFNDDDDTAVLEAPEVQVQRVSAVIPLKKEDPVARARRRIRSIMRAGHVCILAWSSGKDSSALVSLVLSTAKELKEAGESVPPVVVVHSETGVEQPEVVALAQTEMQRMRKYAAAHGLEFQAMLGHPTLSASFPVRVIGGRALPAYPDTRQDCTQDWKISVNEKLMRTAIAKYSKVHFAAPVVCTGVRSGESLARDIKIAKREETAEGIWENDNGRLRASPILDWTADDVWEYLGYCSAGIESSYSDFEETIRIYRAANGGECVIVADMKGPQNRPGCSARTGCWACTRIGASDDSMQNMLKLEPERYGYMQPLADLRDFMVKTQYDWNRRQFVGRTVGADGNIRIAADTFSPGMLLELLRYTLSAQALSGVHIIDAQQLIAIDARWSLYGIHPPFTALKTYFEIMDGAIYHVPDVPHYPKTPQPVLGTIHVGAEWSQVEGPNSLTGLRHPIRELFSEDCGLNLKELNNGNLVIDDESTGEFEVDEEGAIDFLTFIAEEKIADECHENNPDWASGYLTYLQYGTIQIAKGRSTQVDGILRRTRWRQKHNLHGQRSVEELRARCDKLASQQLDLLAA